MLGEALTLDEEQGIGKQVLLDSLLGHLLQQQVDNAFLRVHRLLVQLLSHLVHHLSCIRTKFIFRVRSILGVATEKLQWIAAPGLLPACNCAFCRGN